MQNPIYNMSDAQSPILYDNERLDDLERKSYFVIQKKDGYCFNSDSVLIADAVKANRKEVVVDLGCGSGVISILVAAKTNAKSIVGIEIQQAFADMAKRSVEYNGLDKRIEIKNFDMRMADVALGKESVDVVVTNPPYYTWSGGDAGSLDICRAEVTITLDEVIVTAAKLLKYGGRFYMILKVERLVDALTSMRENRIEPKTLQMVVPKPGRAADTFIVEGRKNGGRGLKMLKDLVVRDENGELTEETRRIYGK